MSLFAYLNPNSTLNPVNVLLDFAHSKFTDLAVQLELMQQVMRNLSLDNFQGECVGGYLESLPQTSLVEVKCAE